MYRLVRRTLLQVNTSQKWVLKSSASVKNVLACRNLLHPCMGIKDVRASVQNIFACKYISPTGIEIVSVVEQIVLAQIVLAGKNLPHRLQIQKYLCP